jgi:hypothetical protein
MHLAIRFICETFTSERDRNGNCYHFAVITSTSTGKRLVIKGVGGESNARYLMSKLLGRTTGERVYSTEVVLPKRQWQRRESNLLDAKWEHEVTGKMIQALEKE